MTSDSGYITTDLFLEWLVHFQAQVKSTESDPVLLILDNHTSHTSLQAILFAREHYIHMISLPPHSSHKTQPLDRCFFKPLKDFYSQSCDNWLLNNPGRVITQYQVASLFFEAYQRAATIGKAVKSFQVCGISPFNPLVFTEEDLLPSAVTDQQEKFDEQILRSRNANLSRTASTAISYSGTGQDSERPSTPTGVAPFETSQDSERPSTSKEVAPSHILPLPKRKDVSLRKSKGKKSVILTSTPNKTELEELQNNRGKNKDIVRKTVVRDVQTKKVNKLKKTNQKTPFKNTTETKNIFKNSEENVTCPGCDETFYGTPHEIWVQCNSCEQWWHEECSSYEGNGIFKCDYCI